MYLYANVSGEYYDAVPEGITTSNSLLNILLDILWIRGVSGTNARKNCLHYTLHSNWGCVLGAVRGKYFGEPGWSQGLIPLFVASIDVKGRKCQQSQFCSGEQNIKPESIMTFECSIWFSDHMSPIMMAHYFFCTYCQITGPDKYSSFSSHCSIPTGKLLYIPLTL